MIQCNIDHCKQIYIGETDRDLKIRIGEHRGYINNFITSKATGYHFNLPGHSLVNMTVTVLEKVKRADTQYRKQREKYFINKFNSFYKGLNRTC